MFCTLWLYRHKTIFLSVVIAALVVFGAELLRYGDVIPAVLADSPVTTWLGRVGAAISAFEIWSGVKVSGWFDPGGWLGWSGAIAAPMRNFAISLPVAFGALAVWPLKPVADRLLPDPPTFIDRALARHGAPPDDARAANRPFVGREAMLATLDMFLAGKGNFVWWAAYGPSGIGKTRLAIEWLRALDRRGGWDAGFLKLGTAVATIDQWTPRRATAIVIDEVHKWGEGRAEVVDAFAQAALRSGQTVRVLAVDVGSVVPPEATETEVKRRLEDTYFRAPHERVPPAGIPAPPAIERRGWRRPAALRLAPLDVAETAPKIARFFGRPAPEGEEALARLHEETGGLPFLLVPELEGIDLWRARDERARKMLEIADREAQADGSSLMTLAALAGPFGHAARRSPFDEPKGSRRLQRIFPQEPVPSLKVRVPGLAPAGLSERIAVVGLEDLESPFDQALVEFAFEISPETATSRATSIIADMAVQEGDQSDESEVLRRSVVSLLDDARAKRGLDAYEAALTLAVGEATEAGSRSDGEDLKDALVRFNELANGVGRHPEAAARVAKALRALQDLMLDPGTIWRGEPGLLPFVKRFFYSRSAPLNMPPHYEMEDGRLVPVLRDVGLPFEDHLEAARRLVVQSNGLWAATPGERDVALTHALVWSRWAGFFGLMWFNGSGDLPPSLELDAATKQMAHVSDVLVEVGARWAEDTEVREHVLKGLAIASLHRAIFEAAGVSTAAAIFKAVDASTKRFRSDVASAVPALDPAVAAAMTALVRADSLLRLLRVGSAMTVAKDEIVAASAGASRELRALIASVEATDAELAAVLRLVSAAVPFVSLLNHIAGPSYAELPAEHAALVSDTVADVAGRLADVPNDVTFGLFVCIFPTLALFCTKTGQDDVLNEDLMKRLLPLSKAIDVWLAEHGDTKIAQGIRVLHAGVAWRTASVRLSGVVGDPEREAAIFAEWLSGADHVRAVYLAQPEGPLALFEYVSACVNFMGGIHKIVPKRPEMLDRYCSEIARRIGERLKDFERYGAPSYFHEEIARGMAMFAGDFMRRYRHLDKNLLPVARGVLLRETRRFPNNLTIAKIAHEFAIEPVNRETGEFALKLPPGIALAPPRRFRPVSGDQQTAG